MLLSIDDYQARNDFLLLVSKQLHNAKIHCNAVSQLIYSFFSIVKQIIKRKKCKIGTWLLAQAVDWMEADLNTRAFVRT